MTEPVGVDIDKTPGLLEFIHKNCKPKSMLVDQYSHQPLEPIGLILHENTWAQELNLNKKKLKPGMNLQIEPLNKWGYFTLNSGFSLTEISFLPIKLNIRDYGTDVQIKLDIKAKSISLNRLGHLSVSKPRYISADRLARYVKYATAQALIDNISNTEEGHVARDFLPTLDFLDVAGERFTNDIWQHVVYPDWTVIYQTGRNCNNDRKVYFLYGIKNLDYPNEKTRLTGIKIKLSSVKTIELQDMSTIDEYGSMFFQRPFLFRKGDDIVIQTRSGSGLAAVVDRMKLLGFVIEPYGANMT